MPDQQQLIIYLFWTSFGLSALVCLAYIVSVIYLSCRRLWKIVIVQLIGIGYFAFGTWALYETQYRKQDVRLTRLISQNLSFSFDSLFHWITCSVYLKAAYVMPYLFNLKMYTNNEALQKQYRQTLQRLDWLSNVNIAVLVFACACVLPMLKWPIHSFIVAYFLNTVSFTFSTFAMIFAVIKLSRSIKEIKSLMPPTCFMLIHTVLLVFLLVSASYCNIYQYVYYETCQNYPVGECALNEDMLYSSNDAFVATNALTFALILYMTYKFLVPPREENQEVQENSWLRGSKTEAISRSSSK
jgi:hypothetical protein